VADDETHVEMRWQRHGGVAANSLLGYSLEVSWWRGWWRPSGGAPRCRGGVAGDVVAWIVSSKRCGGVAGGAGCLLHVRSAPGGVGGGQGESRTTTSANALTLRRRPMPRYLNFLPCHG
jgi:hypothetical protein